MSPPSHPVDPSRLALEIDDSDGVHLVRLFGELDLASADRVRTRLVEIAGSTVEVDLSRLTFIDASGLRALALAKKEIESGGNLVVLRRARGFVRRVFGIAELDHLLSD